MTVDARSVYYDGTVHCDYVVLKYIKVVSTLSLRMNFLQRGVVIYLEKNGSVNLRA